MRAVLLVAVVVLAGCSGSEATGPDAGEVFAAAAEAFREAAPATVEQCCGTLVATTTPAPVSVSNLTACAYDPEVSLCEEMAAAEQRVLADIETELDAVADLMTDLGFGPATFERMTATRAADGMATETSDVATVSWTYAEDAGLHLIAEPVTG